jgi:heptaprenylglyceryl phosphate synthase
MPRQGHNEIDSITHVLVGGGVKETKKTMQFLNAAGALGI